MSDLPAEAITDAMNAVMARHGQLEAAGDTVIPYDMPEFRADVVAALEAAEPALRAAWAADEHSRLSQEIDLEQERCDRLRAEGAAAEREQCAQLADREAAKARNLPYSGSKHRARSLSELADLIREQP